MKVTVELNRDNDESGFESDFDDVTFTTAYADDEEGWAEAVRTFATIGRIVADRNVILMKALCIDGGYHVGDWGELLLLLSEDSLQELKRAIDGSGF